MTSTTWTASIRFGNSLIYALGGGNGHLQRAMILATQCSHATIVHQKQPPYCTMKIISPPRTNAVNWIRQFLTTQVQAYDHFIVDTFPAGLFHEITPHILSTANNSILIARYLKLEAYAKYPTAACLYDKRLLPYPKDCSEWTVPDSEFVGPITRDISISDNIHFDLVIIGQSDRIPQSWRQLFPTRTFYIDEYFNVLPKANGYLCIGAGYNLVWELYVLGLNAAHLPLTKRYDDQFHRAGLLQRSVCNKSELKEFLISCSRTDLNTLQ